MKPSRFPPKFAISAMESLHRGENTLESYHFFSDVFFSFFFFLQNQFCQQYVLAPFLKETFIRAKSVENLFRMASAGHRAIDLHIFSQSFIPELEIPFWK